MSQRASTKRCKTEAERCRRGPVIDMVVDVRPIRCCYCRGFAEYIWWTNGYHHPTCTMCYPKAVKDVGNDTDSMALDGSKIFKVTTVDGGAVDVFS